MSWLDKPYPFIEDLKLRLSLCVGIGFLCFLILLIFQPFGLSTIQEGKSLFLLAFGFNAFCGLFIMFILLPKFLTGLYDIENWQIKNHIAVCSGLILIISVLNYLLNSIIGKSFSPQYSFWMFIYFTTAVGALPIMIITYISERSASKKNSAEAYQLDQLKTGQVQTIEKKITLQSDTAKDGLLNFSLSNFLYAHAQSNYCHLYLKNDESVEEKLLRISLKKVEELMDDASIIRCHRSYLINKHHIQLISGNARSLYLRMSESDKEIPVSRSLDRNLLVS